MAVHFNTKVASALAANQTSQLGVPSKVASGAVQDSDFRKGITGNDPVALQARGGAQIPVDPSLVVKLPYAGATGAVQRVHDVKGSLPKARPTEEQMIQNVIAHAANIPADSPKAKELFTACKQGRMPTSFTADEMINISTKLLKTSPKDKAEADHILGFESQGATPAQAKALAQQVGMDVAMCVK
jgi:hypothetical protein